MIVGKDSCKKGFGLLFIVLVIILVGVFAISYTQAHHFGAIGWIVALLNAGWGGYWIYTLYKKWSE